MLTSTQSKIELSGKAVKELKKVIKGVGNHKIIPILNNVKINLGENEIKVTMNDYNLTVTKKIDAEVQGAGEFLLPMSEIKNLKGFKNDDTFILEIEDYKVKLNNITFTTYNVEDYPKSNTSSFKPIAAITYDDILKLDKSLISIGKSQTRPVLTAVLIRNNEIITTDSHRLFKTDTAIEHSEDILICSEGLKNIKDHFNADSQINVSLSDNCIKFSDHQTTIEIRLQEGNFPDVSRIIPESFNSKSNVQINNVKQFKDIITAASKVHKNSLIKLTSNDGTLKVSANQVDKSFEAEIETKFTGEEISLSMSGKYLLDALKQVEGNCIKFYFHGNLRPFTLQGNDDKSLALVLPVRTN